MQELVVKDLGLVVGTASRKKLVAKHLELEVKTTSTKAAILNIVIL